MTDLKLDGSAGHCVPKSEHGKIQKFLYAIGAAAFVSCAGVISANAADVDGPDGPFELDGNLLPDFAAPGPYDDWSNVNPTGGGANEASYIGSAFSADGIGNDDDIFTMGGSKDIHEISTSWKWKNSMGGPPKDNLANSYGAFYMVDGDLHYYFGYDRVNEGGSATTGIWLLQNNIAKDSGNFTGNHEDGDTLIVIDYEIGGGMPVFVIFQWQSGGLVEVNLAGLGLSTGECDAAAGGHDICAISNLVDLPGAAWVPGGTMLALHFVEGGVNLSALFEAINVPLPCFTDSIVETRSSTSIMAVLKDFILQGEDQSVDICSVKITKQCFGTPTIVNNGTQVQMNWQITVENDGVGTLYDLRVQDTATGYDMTFDTLAPGATIGPINVMMTSTATSVNNVATVAAAASDGGAQTVTDMDNDTCMISPMSGITVTKNCGPDTMDSQGVVLEALNGSVVVKVLVHGRITNSGDEALSGLTLMDNPSFNGVSFKNSSGVAVSLGSVTLQPSDYIDWTGNYYPSSTNSGDPSMASFSDMVTAKGTGVLSSSEAMNSAMTSCTVCPPDEM